MAADGQHEGPPAGPPPARAAGGKVYTSVQKALGLEPFLRDPRRGQEGRRPRGVMVRPGAPAQPPPCGSLCGSPLLNSIYIHRLPFVLQPKDKYNPNVWRVQVHTTTKEGRKASQTFGDDYPDPKVAALARDLVVAALVKHAHGQKVATVSGMWESGQANHGHPPVGARAHVCTSLAEQGLPFPPLPCPLWIPVELS